MSYQKLNLQTGQVLTADALSHIEDGIATASIKCQKVTWAELVQMREESKLMPGTWYRIIDYVTTTTQENTASLGVPFDIIVLALSENEVSERAKAIWREGDDQLALFHLNTWDVWYCLYNDRKYTWADVENGKGVIYRLIDEFGNDLPFDFYNIVNLKPNAPQDPLPPGLFGFAQESLTALRTGAVMHVQFQAVELKIPNIRFMSPAMKNVTIKNSDQLTFLGICVNVTIGDYCSYLVLSNTLGITIERNCFNLLITGADQNTILAGTRDAAIDLTGQVVPCQRIGLNSQGEIKIFNPADLVQ